MGPHEPTRNWQAKSGALLEVRDIVTALPE